MSYSELLRTTDISETWPTNSNENWRKRSFLNKAAKSATFTVWADDAAGSPKDLYVITAAAAVVVNMPATSGADAAAGREVGFHAVDIATAGSITLDPATGDTIEGGASVIMTEGQTRWYAANGTNWILTRKN